MLIISGAQLISNKRIILRFKLAWIFEVKFPLLKNKKNYMKFQINSEKEKETRENKAK